MEVYDLIKNKLHPYKNALLRIYIYIFVIRCIIRVFFLKSFHIASFLKIPCNLCDYILYNCMTTRKCFFHSSVVACWEKSR